MANLTIGISDLKVCRPPDVLVTYALGSCVGICLLDSATGVGGMSHIMLPDSTQATNGAATPMRFADTAIPMLVNEMVKMGANRSRIRAKIAGNVCRDQRQIQHRRAEHCRRKIRPPQGGDPDNRRGHRAELRQNRILLPGERDHGSPRGVQREQATLIAIFL